MRSRLFAAGLALLAGVVLAALWALVGDGDPQGDDDAAGALAPQGAEPVRPAGERATASALPFGDPDPAGPPTSAPAERSAPPQETRAPLMEGGVPSDSTWIEGRVLFRDGTPLDEEVAVEAKGNKRFPGRDQDARSYRARAGRDGRFRVALAPGSRKGWLQIEARYHYLEQKLRVSLKDDPGEVLLEPKLGGIVRGRGLAPIGPDLEQPSLAGGVATVSRWGGGGEWMRRTAKLDAEGRFEIHAVPPGDGYTLSVDSAHFVEGQVGDLAVRPGEVTEAEVELRNGVRIAGRVVDEEDRGLEGTQVWLTTRSTADNDRSSYSESRLAEEGGKFEFDAVRPGAISLEVKKEGFEEAGEELGELGEGELREGLVLRLSGGQAIEGVVQWPDGKPAADAWVMVLEAGGERSFNPFGEDGRVETDAEGRFRVSGLGTGPCDVRAGAREMEESVSELTGKVRRRPRGPRWVAQVEGVAPGTSGLVLVLSRGGTVTGRAVDDTGAPLGRFKVLATPGGEGRFFQPQEMVPLVVRDPDGRFELQGLREGAWTIVASARDHGDSNPRLVSTPYEGPELELVLPRLATVAGTVRAPGGEPVAGARVHIAPAEDPGGMTYVGNRGESARTDDAGAFEVRKAPPGRLRVTAVADGYGESEPLEVELPPAGVATDLALVLRLAGRITGAVHPAAAPIAGRAVIVRRDEGGDYETRRTDSGGRFEVDGLSPGMFTVTLEPAEEADPAGGQDSWILRSAQRREEVVELVPGGSVNVVLGKPSESAIAVRGRVLQAGEPVPHATVTCRATERVGGDRENGTRADAAGRYELVVDGAGKYDFLVGGDWGRMVGFRVEVPEGKSFERDLELPTARLAGRVFGPAGAPLERVQLTLERQAQEDDDPGPASTQHAQSDEEGRFEFENLRAGQYVLQAGGHNPWSPAQELRTYGRVVVPGIELAEGAQRDGLDVELREAGAIEGTVLGPGGEPLPGAYLQVQDMGGRSLFTFISVHTDGAGHFRFPGLAAGRLQIRARHPSGESELAEVEVFEGETSHVLLTIRG